MIVLRFHTVQRCAHHGRSAAALRVEGSEHCLVFALADEDAVALLAAQLPGPAGINRPYGLVAAVAAELGGRVVAVQLHTAATAIVQTYLHLEGPRSAVIVPMPTADGLAFALHENLPLWLSDDDFAAFIAAVRIASTPPRLSQLEPFREVVESLDLADFSGPNAHGAARNTRPGWSE